MLEIDFKRSYKLGKKYLRKNLSNRSKLKNLVEYYKENKKTVSEEVVKKTDNDSYHEEKKIKLYNNRIRVLELLLEVTPKKYVSVLKKRIKQEKFTLLVIQNDEQALNSPEYKKMYNRKKRHEKIKKLLHLS